MSSIKDKIIPEEIEHIINEFVTKNMVTDAAMLFITQDDIDMEDFKYYIWNVNNRRFFINMYKYIHAYIMDLIKREEFENAIPIITKLPIYNYKLIEDQYTFDYEYWSRGILDDIFKFVCTDVSTYRFEEFTTLVYNHNSELAKCMLLANWKSIEPKHMRSILLAEWLNPHDFIQIILQQYKRTNDINLIPEIMETCIIDDYYIIPIVDNLFRRYRFDIKIGNNIKVNTTILYNNDKRMNRCVDMLRSFIASKIHEDADLDIYNLLETSKIRHLESRDILRANIYGDIQRYLFDGTNTFKRKDDMIRYSYEDWSMNIPDNYQFMICTDLLIADYIYSARELSPYQLLLRLYNINRFKFLRNGLSEYLNEYFSYAHDITEELIINIATDNNFWLFCNIFNKSVF